LVNHYIIFTTKRNPLILDRDLLAGEIGDGDGGVAPKGTGTSQSARDQEHCDRESGNQGTSSSRILERWKKFLVGLRIRRRIGNVDGKWCAIATLRKEWKWLTRHQMKMDEK